jgi:hypothetical protein
METVNQSHTVTLNEGTRPAVGVIDERLYTKEVGRFYIYLYINSVEIPPKPSYKQKQNEAHYVLHFVLLL